MRLFVFLVLVGCGSAAIEVRGPADDVPPAAAQALHAQARGLPIERISHAEKGGVDVWEGSWWEYGLEREATVTANGVLVELEVEVRADQVPAPVRAAAFSKYPRATSLRYFWLDQDRYEIEARIDDEDRELVVTSAGIRVLGQGHDDDDDDDDDEDEDEDEDDDDDD